ncbi:MAG TPA: TetR/AcrR family transcriptional regulator [Spirochaetota bacterium]|nr:TetR/AcrR family transcriptional regulator [Spirochaetota bacterium]HPQ55179.1 TetR/AcrR family transcriptional regulator [Spirochaetota bacterium]
MDKVLREKGILEAAMKIFAHYGFKKATVEDVATSIGMTKGNIYFYVSSKKDLYEKTVRYGLQSWRDSIAAAIQNIEKIDERFYMMAVQAYEYLDNHEDLRAIVEKDPAIFSLSPGEDRFHDINLGAMDIMRGILHQGISADVFYPMDVHHMTEFLFSVYIMFLIRAYVKSEGSSVSIMYREGLGLMMRGLCRNGFTPPAAADE